MAKGGESIAPLADWYTLGSKLSIYNLSVPISWFYLCDHFLTNNVNSTQRISMRLQWRCCCVYGKPSVSVACQKPFMSFYFFLPMFMKATISYPIYLGYLRGMYGSFWHILFFGKTPGYADFIIEIPKINPGSWLKIWCPTLLSWCRTMHGIWYKYSTSFCN